MNSRKETTVAEASSKPVVNVVKTGRIAEACSRYNIGATTMHKVAEEAGAVIHVGKIWLCNFSIMDQWMDDHSGII